ncbi:unnamed protein product, partial [Mesorhabditis belari]|uniref:G-protein coupled receptors family 1 profile domain-containing protein n=1 Tax=Mesorhabditis belari TaxID=2138241 RepID=A0AAF3FRA2_9BILA
MDSQQLMATAILVIVIIGCLGNILSFTLFSRPHMRASSVNVLLCALSFVDFTMLFLMIPCFVLPGFSIWETNEGHLTYMAYILKFVYPVNLIMQTCSIYIMVMITMERWTAVCRPLQVRIWCTPKKSRIAILVIFLCSVAYNAIRFFEYSIKENETGVIYERYLRDERWYMLGYFTGLYLLTHFLVPFSILAVMNGHVIVTMWRHRSQRQLLTRQQRREQSTTIMLLVVTGMFAFCNTLPFLMNLVECAMPDLFSHPSTAGLAYQLNDLTNLLVALNSGTTFLVYAIFSEKYRQTICFMLKNGCCATVSDFNAYTNMSRTASMRVTSTGHTQNGHKLSTCSRSSEMLLKPTQIPTRAERSVSEYNSRMNGKLRKQKCSLDETSRFSGIMRKKIHKFSMGDSMVHNAAIQSATPTPEITITVTEEEEQTEVSLAPNDV